MKRRIFGEPVTARDVEQLAGDSGGAHFVRLCAALIRRAISSGAIPPGALEVTERVNVRDSGVDAQIILPVSPTVPESGGLVGPGRTVFQFKYRDVTSGDRSRLINTLASRLREEARKFKGDCERFVLMTNLHLAGAEAHKLRDAISQSLPGPRPPFVDVSGAAEIAARLNVAPDLRHLFFAEGGLSTLDTAETELRASYERLGWTNLIDRAAESSAISGFLDDPKIRLLHVGGRRYSGRTRLVLESLKSHKGFAVWANAPDVVSVDLFRDLDTPDGPVLVIDDCDGQPGARVVEWARQRQHLKTIVIELADEAASTLPGAAQVIVPPLQDDDARALLHQLVPGLTFGQRTWIVESTAGLPGLIAHVGAGARELVIEPSDPPAFERRLRILMDEMYIRGLSPEAQRALAIAALLPVLGIEGAVGREVEAVTQSLGASRESLEAQLPALQRRGLVRRRGRFVEVVPPLLADHLVAERLRDPERVLAELEIALPTRFLSFLERLGRLPNQDIRRALTLLLEGWCADFDGLMRNADRLRVLVGAIPDASARCIERALQGVTADVLKREMKGGGRRDVVWALEDLALRAATFQRAARQLLLLAEAENETYANSATGEFLSLFHWRHPEISASLEWRLSILREAGVAASAIQRKIAAEASGAAFADEATFGLHHPNGADLPELPYRPGTWQEVLEYAAGVLSLLRMLQEDEAKEVRAQARKSFLNVVTPILEVALHALSSPDAEGVIDSAFGNFKNIARSAESAGARADMIRRAALLRKRLARFASAEPAASSLFGSVAGLEREMSGGSAFRDELWRWVGPTTWRQDGLDRETAAAKLEEIARRFVGDGGFGEHLRWLLSDDAGQGTELFHVLGKLDLQRRLLPPLLEGAEEPKWSERFSAYFAGWGLVDAAGAAKRLDSLVGSQPEMREGLLRAATLLPPDATVVDRILSLRAAGFLNPVEFARRVSWALSWDQLPDSDAQRLMEELDDGTAEVRAELLSAFITRIGRGALLSPALQELAWTFLAKSFHVAAHRDRHDWDDLAARLGESDPMRLLKLIEAALTVDGRATDRLSWQDEVPLVWEVLAKRERRGLLELLLRLASRPDAPYQLGWALEEFIDPERDREVLLRFVEEAGVDGARTVAEHLRPESGAFWDVARRVVALRGSEPRVRDRLLGALVTGGWSGSPVPMIRQRLERARELASDRDARVASWGQEAVSVLEEWLRRAQREDGEDWIWDYRIRRSEIEQMVGQPDSPERRWAVERLLKYAPPKRVIELLTPSEILNALPALDRETRGRWEGWARVWSDRH